MSCLHVEVIWSELDGGLVVPEGITIRGHSFCAENTTTLKAPIDVSIGLVRKITGRHDPKRRI